MNNDLNFISQQSIYELGRELLNMLEIIHNSGFVYNNLAPENIIFNTEKTIRLRRGQPENCFNEYSAHLIDFSHATPYRDLSGKNHLR